MVLGLNLGSAINDVTGTTDDGARTFKRPFGFGYHNNDAVGVGGQVNPGQEGAIISYIVDAGREYAWGYGAAKYEANQGYMSGDIVAAGDNPNLDAGDSIKGTVILEQHSSTGREQKKVREIENGDLPAGSDGDRSTKEPLPEQDGFPLVTQDSRLVVTFKPDAQEYDNPVTVDEAASELSIPVTEYDLSMR